MSWWQWLLLVYFAAVSLIAFILPLADKRRAKRGKWRIRESTLFIVSLLGGSLAMYISMKLFHHKTKHKRFMIGIPLIIVLQITVIFFIYFFVLK